MKAKRKPEKFYVSHVDGGGVFGPYPSDVAALDAAEANGIERRKAEVLSQRDFDEIAKRNPSGRRKRRKNPSSDLFSAEHIAKLQRAYAKIHHVNPGSESYRELIAQLDGLTQSQLKQIAGAEILFLSKLARNRVRKGNPIKGPGKFEGELYAGRFAFENPDDEIGNVDELGWYGTFVGKIKGRGPFYILTNADSQGFVRAEFFDSEKELKAAWRDIEKEYESFYEAL